MANPNRFRIRYLLAMLAATPAIAMAQPTHSGSSVQSVNPGLKAQWRYYRPTNTGIQGDFCDALWIGPDGDPWIGGYQPQFEEGGLSKFVQSENRWVNVSNVDYREIGHPEATGVTRVRDIVPDSQGNLWMGTGRGVLRFNPSLGARSLKRYDASNSPLPGGWTTNIEISPDGFVWASAYSTVWGNGGLSRFNLATQSWQSMGASRGEVIAVQPRPGGRYYVWATPRDWEGGQAQRYDSTTQSWTSFAIAAGNPRALAGNKSADESGNVWLYRVRPDGFSQVLDCLRPDGTWIGVPPPPVAEISAFRAYGNLRALCVDQDGNVLSFDGAAWHSLDQWRPGRNTMDVASDAAGNVWVCGVGGAAKRSAQTGQWQRYRVTNTSQYDFFNSDLALAPGGGAYASANAGPGAGGTVRFDGVRWTGYNDFGYGLGGPWPFGSDNSRSVAVRSDGTLVANPTFQGLHELRGGAWRDLQFPRATAVSLVEDSFGRLWGLGEYFFLAVQSGQGWAEVPVTGIGVELARDPSRAGTVWALTLYEARRTDGAFQFARSIDDFPELTSQSDYFTGLAVGPDGVAWIGCTVMLGAGGTGGGLIRLNPATGAYSMLRREAGWPFPGDFVRPLEITPDGKLWMVYTSATQPTGGLCWWDGTRVGTFPAPVDGAPQWGGLPHLQIVDTEVRTIPGGYEIWMSCLSRGIAVLTVRYPQPIGPSS